MTGLRFRKTEACERCGYDMRDSPSHICSECGYAHWDHLPPKYPRPRPVNHLLLAEAALLSFGAALLVLGNIGLSPPVIDTLSKAWGLLVSLMMFGCLIRAAQARPDSKWYLLPAGIGFAMLVVFGLLGGLILD